MDEDSDRLQSESGLATAYFFNQQFQEAFRICQHVLAIGKRTLAEADLPQLALKRNLDDALRIVMGYYKLIRSLELGS